MMLTVQTTEDQFPDDRADCIVSACSPPSTYVPWHSPYESFAHWWAVGSWILEMSPLSPDCQNPEQTKLSCPLNLSLENWLSSGDVMENPKGAFCPSNIMCIDTEI